MKPPSIGLVSLSLLLLPLTTANTQIDRHAIVQQFNPIRHSSSNTSALQVGNGNFAFGADITGLQTFLPYNTLSSWCWHNASLPVTQDQTDPADFTGLDWWTHGRLVGYDMPNPAEAEISDWLVENPQRVNLGRVGLWFGGENLTEGGLEGKVQELDLWEGVLRSRFGWRGDDVTVETVVDSGSDTVAVRIESDLLVKGELGMFFDYPYTDTDKFDAPFVGNWTVPGEHKTILRQRNGRCATIEHNLDATTYFTTIQWGEGNATIEGPLYGTHRYILQPLDTSSFSFTANFGPSAATPHLSSFGQVKSSSETWWREYWSSGAFVDMTASNNTSATSLQHRAILSQYLLAVNGAGDFPAQESGLANNGWYGKFHMEEVLWHIGHWARWGRWNLFSRSTPSTYSHFLPTSISRAQAQGYRGARWGKESDPSGRSAPGEINSLLIWQQPHPFYLAELEYRAFPTPSVLQKWDTILTYSADFMASYAFFNSSTQIYDLGPPMYPVSENTNPNATINPTFELAYWRFGLDIAMKWKERQNLSVSRTWEAGYNKLAPLPIDLYNDTIPTYPTYEGIPNMWLNSTTASDHPAMTGIYGLLSPGPDFNLTVMQNTATLIANTWDFPYSYGWDFPLLAMNSLRLGDAEKAVEYLLNENFEFDDAGWPIGGERVPTPYFPSAGALLLTVAMMAGGWEGGEGMHFPDSWTVEAEGFSVGL